MRDRVSDEMNGEGSVDKSVVNWLMHVISGKAPIELGINDSAAVAAEVVEPKLTREAVPRPELSATLIAMHEAPLAKPEVRAPSLGVTAEDLCGTPLYPVVNEMRAQVPVESNGFHEEVTAADLCFVPSEQTIMAELNASGKVVRMGGPQLVEMPKPPAAVPAEAKPSGVDVFREGVFAKPPESEASAAIADSLRAPTQQQAVPGSDEVDPLEFTRDPEYYEEKMRAGKAVSDEVDWIPAIPAAAPSSSVVDFLLGGTQRADAKVPEAEPAEVEAKTAEPVTAAEPATFEAEAVEAKVKPEAAVAVPERAKAVVVPAVVLATAIVDPFAAINTGGAEVLTVPGMVEAKAEPEAAAAVPEAWAAHVSEPIEHDVAAAAQAIKEPEVQGMEFTAAPVQSGDWSIPAAGVLAEVAEHKPDWLIVPAAGEAAADHSAPSELPRMAVEARKGTSDGALSAEKYYRQQFMSQPGVRGEAKDEWTTGTESSPQGMTAALKTLMQLGSVLPLAARMAPILDGTPGAELATGGNQEVKQEVSGLRLLQYEIKTTVQDHSTQLKRLEEQLTRVQESVELDSTEKTTVMDSVKSTVKLVRVMGIGLGALLLVLILMVGMMLMHAK
ncbi:MAG TPA: hypothetical protein VME86_10650 [Acidobacteriaceae bacterium]|nr:hypothetical protein [Acidobacteriaceae bacterium]